MQLDFRLFMKRVLRLYFSFCATFVKLKKMPRAANLEGCGAKQPSWKKSLQKVSVRRRQQ